MADETETNPPVPPKRQPGHRSTEVKDTVAEMAAKAHEISLEAGSKMAAAMKDVINAAAGITGFVVESARDLVQYMVRRGQMTQEEADKLIRQVEEFRATQGGGGGSGGGSKSSPSKPAEPAKKASPAPVAATPVAKPASAVAKPVAKPAAPAKKATPVKATPVAAKKAPAKKTTLAAKKK